MYLFHPVNTRWLPPVSLFLIAFTIASVSLNIFTTITLTIIVPVIFFIIIFYGLLTVLENTGVSLGLFFRRPANIATFVRSMFVLAGLICGIMSFKWISAVLMFLGYMADFLDGWLARREKFIPASAQWGGWYDAETDALLLLFTSIFLLRLSSVSYLILIPALCRYGFALIFWIFPSDYKSLKWYHWYSKTVAAVFESVAALLWCTILFSDSSMMLEKFMQIQIKLFVPATVILILSSFILESIFRLRSILSSIPPGYRAGILHSFLVYFRIPFRHGRMRKFYGSLIQKSDLTFDVGAHLGNRTRIFLELGAEVVSFEPQPACKELLKLWFGSHKKVHLNFTALGASEKEVKMMLSRRNPTLASTDESWVDEMLRRPEFKGVEWDGVSTTEVKTLDSMIEKYGTPRFIKIDTEGNEREVLEGLNHKVKVVSFEFLPSQKDRAMDCILRLKEIGKYNFNYSIGESMTMCLKDYVSDEKIKEIIDSYPVTGKSGDVYAICQEID